MNPRQRRGVLLMLLAALGAVAVFVSVLSYVGQVRAQVGNMRTVLRLTEDVDAYEEISADMIEPVQRPAKWTSQTMLSDAAALQGKVAASELPRGTYLQQGSVIPSPTLQPGQREIAILIDAETSVAGKVNPGSVVDIYATFDGTEDQPAACSVRVMAGARVLSVGELQVAEGTEGGQVEQDKVVPLTFALTAQEVNRLMYAESFSNTLRLARVGGLSDATPTVEPQCEVPLTSDTASTEQSAAGSISWDTSGSATDQGGSPSQSRGQERRS